jgi:ATP synthase protein I
VQNKEKDSSPTPKPNLYLRYSGLGVQMICTIGAFTYGGIKLDEYLQNTTPLATIILSLLGVIGSLIVVVRGLTQESK